MAESSADLHVIIIGAGITGLLLAQALTKYRTKVSIFDQDPGLGSRRREWTLAIHWSIPLLKDLLPADILSRLAEAHCDPFYIYDKPVEIVPLYNGGTGEILKHIPAPGMERFSRSRLRKLFSEGVDVQWGKELLSLTHGEDGGVTAKFKDGTEFSGDLIVGADGVSSAVRDILMGKEKAERKILPFWNNGVVVRYKDVEKARSVRNGVVTQMAFSPDGTFSFISVQDVLDPNDPTTWTFQLNSSWPGDQRPGQDSASILAAIKSRHEHLAEPFRSANLWIEEGTLCHSSLTQYWVPEKWDNRGGRITLIGDAAHTMPPYRGQGLNHCIDDVAKLIQAIKSVTAKPDLRKTIDTYEEEMIARTKTETELSIENCYMVHDWEKVQASPMLRMGIVKSG